MTEAAMLGYRFYSKWLNPKLIILSDAEDEFKLQRNAACWVYAERILTAVIPESEFIAHLKDKNSSGYSTVTLTPNAIKLVFLRP